MPYVLGLHPEEVVDHGGRVGLARSHKTQVVKSPVRKFLEVNDDMP